MKPWRVVFDLGLCSDYTLPICPEDRKECWHSQCENKCLKIGSNVSTLLVCVFRVCMVAFTILPCVIQKPVIGGILNWKLKSENKPEVKLLHSYCLYSFPPLKFTMDFSSFMFLHILTATPLGSSNWCLDLAFMAGLNLKENLSISVGRQEKLEELVSC